MFVVQDEYEKPNDHHEVLIMSQNVTYPPVTETLYEEIVRRILSVGMPTKIVLFGSYARGEAHQDSDLDILIIKKF
jgi:UTP:GlnB (protein PII) uridylyltransferase